MPRLFGMEPEKWKPIALVGGGAVVLFLFLKGKGQGGGAPAELVAAPPTDSGPLAAAPSGGAAASEYDSTRAAAEALQLQFGQQELAQRKAAGELALQVGKAQAELETTRLHRQEDVIRTKPVSCPHGSEVRLGPDGTPYCRSSKGAVTFGNTVSEPAADTIKQLIPTAIKAYAAPYLGPGGYTPPIQQTRRPGQPTEPGLERV